jgi:hypothetical protein
MFLAQRHSATFWGLAYLPKDNAAIGRWPPHDLFPWPLEALTRMLAASCRDVYSIL